MISCKLNGDWLTDTLKISGILLEDPELRTAALTLEADLTEDLPPHGEAFPERTEDGTPVAAGDGPPFAARAGESTGEQDTR